MVALPDNLAEKNAPGNLARGVVRFHPWQERWFRDRARVKVIKAHRQSGKDFDAAAEAVDGAFKRHDDWFIVSVTQRQADATFAKAKQIAGAFKRVMKKRGEITFSDREYVEWDAEIEQEFRCVARTLHLPGGGSVTALPGRDPDTLAGLTGNIIFTEFALFPKGGYDHWRVIFPLITRGYRIIVISTPRGKNTKFFELCSDPAVYSVHVQTIEDSVREGFQLYDQNGETTTVEAFKRLYGDEAGWRREYLCEETGDMDALVRWAVVQEAGAIPNPYGFELARLERGAGWDASFFAECRKFGGRLEIGWDVARHTHFSAVWANQYTPKNQGVRHLVRMVLMQECEFALQREILTAAMQAGGGNVGCGDATGLGEDSNETLHTRYADRWQPVKFTLGAKRDLGSLLATNFGDRTQGLPPMDGPEGPGEYKFIGTDIYALQKEGQGKDLVLAETENPLLPDSHCDLAYAGALALRAGRIVYVEPKISVWS